MKLLPYSNRPIFLSYHNIAFPFGIIQANSPEDITRWSCTKCVNCVYYSNSPKNKFNIDVWDVWGVDEQLITYRRLKIKKNDLGHSEMDLLNALKDAINNNCYIQGWFNEKFIPGKWAFNNIDYLHDFLIIGCDNEKFISVGYVGDGRFKQFEIPNENFIDSLFKMDGDEIELYLIKYEPGITPTPNINRMIDDLKKYISTADYGANPTLEEISYGIATNFRLKDFFVDEVNKGKIYIDKRYSQVFLEHKWVLSQLVDLFIDEESKKKYQECANRNLERAKLVHMLGLKMGYTRNANIINRVTELIDQIIAEEMEYIPALVELIEANYLM